MNDQLKHRVLGAIVLIALGVIFIPMILDFRKEDKTTFASPIPPKPKEQITTLTIPLQPANVPPVAPPQVEPGTPTPEVPPTQSVPKPDKPIEAESKPNAEPEPKKPPSTNTPQAKKPVPPMPSPNAWVVQLGSFSNEKNALALRDRLRKAGYAAYVEDVPGKKDIVRVRIGPELARSKADALKDRLKKQLSQQAVVMPYR